MAAKEFPLSVVIRAVDRVTAPMRGIQNVVRRFDQRIGAGARALSDKLGLPAATEATKRLGTAMGDLGSAAMRVTGIVAGIGGALVGLGALALRSLVGTASTFEKYGTILETIEGSQDKAKKALDWVSDFAQKTPYELNEVMDSFVKLRAYGIDPTNGTLSVLGDTAAAMGKPVMQAVEALADALTGENERLKEFGIRASKDGDTITYEYMQNGKTMRRSAQLSNRAMVQATLMAIWNERYAGAMDKLSGTWGGMMSNLSDQWQRFKLMIMQSGPFELLRGRLAKILERIDAMAKSGELQALAEKIGTFLVEAFDKLWKAGEDLIDNWDEIKLKAKPFTDAIGWLTDRFGTLNVIIGVVSVVIGVTLVASLAAATAAVWSFTVAILANPIGLIVVAILAAAVAIAYFSVEVEDGKLKLTKFGEVVKEIMHWVNIPLMLYRAFRMNKDALVELWNMAKSAFDWMQGKLSSLVDVAGQFGEKIKGAMPDWVQRMFSGAAHVAIGSPVGAALGAARVAADTVGAQQGQVRVQVDLGNLPPGSRVTTDQRGTPNFELNQGYAFGS